MLSSTQSKESKNMKTIKFESNYGNFDYRMTAQTPDGGAEVLEVQGLANIAYRVAGSSVDKALGTKDRKSVLYSKEDAQRINAAVSAKLTELEGKNAALKACGISFAVTGQHVFGEGAVEATKEATEMWTKLQSNPDEEQFKRQCKHLGIDPEAGDDEKAIAACVVFLREQKRKAIEVAKAKAAGELANL